MQKVTAVLFAAASFAGAVQAAEPVHGAAQAYGGIAVSGVDYVGAATKASPKAFAGVQFGKRLAVEGGGVDLKNGYGMYIAIKPSLPLTDKLSVYGKVGVAQTRLPVAPVPAQGLPGKKTNSGAYGAFGLQYAIGPNAAITAEYERLPLEKPSVLKPNVWTLALQFFF